LRRKAPEIASLELIESDQGDMQVSHAFDIDPRIPYVSIQRWREPSGDTKPGIITAPVILDYPPAVAELFTGQL
jgi:hypothetical protein